MWGDSSGSVASSKRGSGSSACAASLFFSSRRRHTIFDCDWSSDVCSSDLSASQSGRNIPSPTEPARVSSSLSRESSSAPFETATAPAQERSFSASMPTSCKLKDRKSTRLNSSHSQISYAVFCLKKKKEKNK